MSHGTRLKMTQAEAGLIYTHSGQLLTCVYLAPHAAAGLSFANGRLRA